MHNDLGGRMEACGTCGITFDDAVFAQCPKCVEECLKCGTLYNSDQLTMCPECRAVERGEIEFPRWMQDAAAAHNKRAVRARWTLAIGIAVFILIIIWIAS